LISSHYDKKQLRFTIWTLTHIHRYFWNRQKIENAEPYVAGDASIMHYAAELVWLWTRSGSNCILCATYLTSESRSRNKRLMQLKDGKRVQLLTLSSIYDLPVQLRVRDAWGREGTESWNMYSAMMLNRNTMNSAVTCADTTLDSSILWSVSVCLSVVCSWSAVTGDCMTFYIPPLVLLSWRYINQLMVVDALDLNIYNYGYFSYTESTSLSWHNCHCILFEIPYLLIVFCRKWHKTLTIGRRSAQPKILAWRPICL